jgi:hypothetical protein
MLATTSNLTGRPLVCFVIDKSINERHSRFKSLKMISPTERPFEVLKLIRDGFITHISELRKADARSYYLMDTVVAKLVRLGLVTRSATGKLEPTPRLSRFFAELGVSLTKLSPFNTARSVITTPVFGVPVAPGLKAEVLTLMPFAEELKPVYEDHIKKVVKQLGLTVARADDFFAASAVISDIWNSIYAAKVIIADCTGRNPNVFYEIGIAHTLGKSVVLVARSAEDIPFDVQHLRALIYEYTPRGMEQFETKLQATIQHEISIPTSLYALLQMES